MLDPNRQPAKWYEEALGWVVSLIVLFLASVFVPWYLGNLVRIFLNAAGLR